MFQHDNHLETMDVKHDPPNEILKSHNQKHDLHDEGNHLDNDQKQRISLYNPQKVA